MKNVVGQELSNVKREIQKFNNAVELMKQRESGKNSISVNFFSELQKDIKDNKYIENIDYKINQDKQDAIKKQQMIEERRFLIVNNLKLKEFFDAKEQMLTNNSTDLQDKLKQDKLNELKEYIIKQVEEYHKLSGSNIPSIIIDNINKIASSSTVSYLDFENLLKSISTEMNRHALNKNTNALRNAFVDKLDNKIKQIKDRQPQEKMSDSSKDYKPQTTTYHPGKIMMSTKLEPINPQLLKSSLKSSQVGDGVKKSVSFAPDVKFNDGKRDSKTKKTEEQHTHKPTPQDTIKQIKDRQPQKKMIDDNKIDDKPQTTTYPSPALKDKDVKPNADQSNSRLSMSFIKPDTLHKVNPRTKLSPLTTKLSSLQNEKYVDLLSPKAFASIISLSKPKITHQERVEDRDSAKGDGTKCF